MRKLFYVFLLMVLGSAMFFVMYNRRAQHVSLSQTTQPPPAAMASSGPSVPSSPQPSIESSGIFTHPVWHFSIQYPVTWRLRRETVQDNWVALWPQWDDDERYFSIKVDPPEKSDLSLAEYVSQHTPRNSQQWTEKAGNREWVFSYSEDYAPFYSMLAYTKVNGIVYTFIVQPHEYPHNTPDPTIDAKVKEVNQVFRFVLQTFQPGG